eukprot:14390710-Heterocapsa_arctica.AAC.1
MINTLPGLESYLSQLDALLLQCTGEQPSSDMMTCRFHRQIEKLPVLNRAMEDYSRMRNDEPNRSYEWLRLRCNVALEIGAQPAIAATSPPVSSPGE